MAHSPVQLERLRPAQLAAAMARAPVAYIPFGATEYHGRHNPVGLDSIKAHHLLIRLAERVGGVVVPPLFYGVDGGHTGFAWTWMVEEDALVSILLSTMSGLERSGARVIALMSGHYPNRGLFTRLEEEYTGSGGQARLVFMIDYMAFDGEDGFCGDHASKWETSYLLALDPETVDMGLLEANDEGRRLSEFAIPEPLKAGSWWFEKDPDHPFFGIAAAAGNLPTDASPELGTKAVDQVVSWAEGKVRAALDEQ